MACVAIASSCGVSTAEVDGEDFEDLGIAEGSARVTPQQAVQANLIVDSTRAYLPYAYKADGCYARALYMSMELAGRRIPTSAQYISGYLQPTPEVAWGWHVAPMVEIDGSGGQRTILDPALAPEGPVPLNEWIRRDNPIGSYTLEWTLGSVYYTSSYSHRNAEATPVIQSFSELTPFQKNDIEQACSVMHSYLDYEGTSATVAKQKLLLGRTRTLANRLLAVGKLDGFAVGDRIGCGGRNVPLCRDPGAACATSEDCCSLLCAGVCKARPVDLVDAGLPVVPDTGSPWDAGSVSGVDGGSTALLQSGVPVTGLSGGARSSRAFRFEVPAGATAIRFELHGGAGDADLYVRFGAPPTAMAYDYRPYGSDSEETVIPSPVRSGTWFVMVTGYSSFSGVTLKATHEGGGLEPDAGTGGGSTPELLSGAAVTGLSGAANTTRLFRFEVPAGATAVRFEMHGAAGDADLYVRFGAAPTTTSYDYRPYRPDAEETVIPSPVRSGTWFVVVNGYTSYSGVSLVASHTP